MLDGRVRELAEQIRGGGTPPVLLATPATEDGHVDAARVLLRLVEAEAGGWQPGPWDLAQALLRLPRRVDPAVTAAAERLTSPAGMRFAAWLRGGGLPDPAARRAAPAALEPDGPVPAADDAAHLAYWPMMLPGHREIIAAHLRPHLAASGSAAQVLPLLALSGGPFGPATAACLGYGLAAPEERDRRAAVEAVLHLAGTGGLDAGQLGRELGSLLTTSAIVPGRLVRALAEVAAAGAHHVVWTLARTLVPQMLRMDRPPQATPDLLALATAAAAATGAQADLPEVTAAAARPNRTRLHAEAARLARTISAR